VKAQDLVGTWRLKTWQNVGSDGSVVDPLGEQPLGYIFYNHDGYVSVEMMAQHRAPYRDPNPTGGTTAERSEAISTYLSYSGRYEVLPDQDTVIHHVEICSYPNWIGNAQVRYAKLDGDVLRLTSEPMTAQGVDYKSQATRARLPGCAGRAETVAGVRAESAAHRPPGPGGTLPPAVASAALRPGRPASEDRHRGFTGAGLRRLPR
jgi:hypothetical protein